MQVDSLDHDGGIVVVLLENSRVRSAQVPRTCAEGLAELKRRWIRIRELWWCRPKEGTLEEPPGAKLAGEVVDEREWRAERSFAGGAGRVGRPVRGAIA
jgi:hypothetical protein